MRIAIDATYSVDANPSGVAVYSSELLSGLAIAHPEDQFLHCYRLKQWRQAPAAHAGNAHRRLLLPPLPTFRASLFHALNQRVSCRPAKQVVCTFHDLFVMTGEYSSAEFRTRFTKQAKQAAANSDLIIAVSEFTATQVTTLLGFPRSRIRVIPHGVRIPPFSRPLASREKIILFVGALQVRKNISRLVTAFETMPPAWRLVLAGSAAGFGAGSILEQIGTSPARDRIEVTGYVTNARLEELYQRSSIFAFASLDEGFGIPVLEAMAHGVPVITSNNSALREVAGNAACLIDPKRVDAIAQALNELADDQGKCTNLRELGLHHVQKFTWTRSCAETYAAYSEILPVKPYL